MDIIIYATDVRNFEEEVDKSFNIAHMHGNNLFDDNDRLTLKKMEEKDYVYSLEPHTYLSIMMDMQEQLNEQHDKINDLIDIHASSRLYNLENSNE